MRFLGSRTQGAAFVFGPLVTADRARFGSGVCVSRWLPTADLFRGVSCPVLYHMGINGSGVIGVDGALVARWLGTAVRRDLRPWQTSSSGQDAKAPLVIRPYLSTLTAPS